MKDNHEIDICKESKEYDCDPRECCYEQREHYYEPRDYYYDSRENSYEPKEHYYEQKEHCCEPKEHCYKQPVYLCKCKCEPHKGPKPGRALLNCGCGSGAQIPIIAAAILGSINPIPLASVTIDASCLKNPTTLLTFTSEIQSVVDVALRLNFLVKRSSKSGCCQYICGTHNFTDTAALDTVRTFSFQVCDKDPCDECVTYSVEYVPIDIVVALGAAINNVTLNAIAVENLC